MESKFFNVSYKEPPLPPQVICAGEGLIDIIPAQRGQSLQEASQLERMAGGSTANVAVALARLGIRAGFLGKVGDDPFGHFLRETLVQEGVDVRQMFMGKEANTGLAFAWLDGSESGEVKYLFYRQPSADRFLKAEEIDWDWCRQAQILAHSSLNLAHEPSATAIRTALTNARANRQLVCYDVNMRLPAWPDHPTARAGMLAALDTCDIVKLNQYELAFLTGISDPIEGAKKLWREQTRLVLVTLDREGCYFLTATSAGYVPGFEVEVADSIGAGDGFVAGLLAYILQIGLDYDDPTQVEKACRYANAVGALVVTQPGAIPAMPTLQQVEKFLEVQL